MASKKVLFLQGSPRGTHSASFKTAKYLSYFMKSEAQFLDVDRAGLSANPTESDPAFQRVVDAMRAADAVVWVFGSSIWFVPVRMQRLFDKLFTLDFDFTGKLSATVMTSVRIQDDWTLNQMRFVSEQLGFSYLGDVSAVGNPFFGYEVEDEEETESCCRTLAARLDKALAEGRYPAPRHARVERRFLSPAWRGPALPVEGPPAAKSDSRTILVLTGNRLAEDPANRSVVEAISRFSRNRIEVVELEDRRVGRCTFCYLCNFRREGTCVVRDDYNALLKRLHEVDGVVLVGTAASGIVDPHMKAFLERSWGLFHRPTLHDKHGFVVATGGGPLEPQLAFYLQSNMLASGIRCTEALTASMASPEATVTDLQRAVEDLDQAIEERWVVPLRAESHGHEAAVRTLVMRSGMILRADYDHLRKTGQLKNKLVGPVTRWLFHNKAIKRRLIALQTKRIEQARRRRLEAYALTDLRDPLMLSHP